MITNKILRIGVLGCADIAQRRIIPALKDMDCYKLVAVASRSANKAQEFANRFNCEPIVGYDNLIQRSDIDAVYIPLPNSLHYGWIKKSLLAGKHVFCEKSITTNYAEAEEIVAISREKKKALYENFMFLFHSQFKFVKEQLNDGAIGKLHFMNSVFGFPRFGEDNNIRYKKELGGGVLLDAGTYTVKAARLFMGDDVQLSGTHLYIHPHYKIDWRGSVILSNSQGLIATLSFSFDNYYQNKIELWGTDGKMIIERAFTAPPNLAPVVVIEKQNDIQKHVLPPDNQCMNIFADFYDAVFSDDPCRRCEDILMQSRLIAKILHYGQ